MCLRERRCRSSTTAPAICSSTSTARRRTRAPRCSPTRSERRRWRSNRIISTTTRCCGRSPKTTVTGWRAGRWRRAVAVVSVDGEELYLSREANLFPRLAPDPDALLDAIRAHDCAGVGYWSLGADDRLGVRLVARGFGWGWRPHWMAIELEDEERSAATGPDARRGRRARAVRRTAVRPHCDARPTDPGGSDSRAIGQISINPTGRSPGSTRWAAPRVRAAGRDA